METEGHRRILNIELIWVDVAWNGLYEETDNEDP